MTPPKRKLVVKQAPQKPPALPERSSYMDTLRAVSGGKDTKVIRNKLSDALLGVLKADGAYQPAFNTVLMPSVVDPYGDEEVLAHEMGHRRQMGSNPFKSAGAMYDAPNSAPERPIERAAFDKIDPYYKTSPSEGYAQAFKTAVQILRNTANPSSPILQDDKIRSGIGEAESVYPGVGSIIRSLLNEPIYAKHPLHQFIK